MVRVVACQIAQFRLDPVDLMVEGQDVVFGGAQLLEDGRRMPWRQGARVQFFGIDLPAINDAADGRLQWLFRDHGHPEPQACHPRVNFSSIRAFHLKRSSNGLVLVLLMIQVQLKSRRAVAMCQKTVCQVNFPRRIRMAALIGWPYLKSQKGVPSSIENDTRFTALSLLLASKTHGPSRPFFFFLSADAAHLFLVPPCDRCQWGRPRAMERAPRILFFHDLTILVNLLRVFSCVRRRQPRFMTRKPLAQSLPCWP
ncbi:hypothetical protein BC940DRAFT_104250 [Gongronella butleri]|nr:hypothetical protein BC940DRAFT_104250 [Gongronella butleri]